MSLRYPHMGHYFLVHCTTCACRARRVSQARRDKSGPRLLRVRPRTPRGHALGPRTGCKAGASLRHLRASRSPALRMCAPQTGGRPDTSRTCRTACPAEDQQASTDAAAGRAVSVPRAWWMGCTHRTGAALRDCAAWRVRGLQARARLHTGRQGGGVPARCTRGETLGSRAGRSGGRRRGSPRASGASHAPRPRGAARRATPAAPPPLVPRFLRSRDRRRGRRGRRAAASPPPPRPPRPAPAPSPPAARAAPHAPAAAALASASPPPRAGRGAFRIKRRVRHELWRPTPFKAQP